MNLFLSYASEQRSLAEELCHRLQAAGFAVFFDREDLPAGESYDDHIRQGIESAQLFIFLVTPQSVAEGRYTRTELKIAARRWPSPGQHVLPVLAAPTPFDTIPAYLRALHLLQPEGNLAAEVLLEVRARVQALAPPPDAPAPSPTARSGPPALAPDARVAAAGAAQTVQTAQTAGASQSALTPAALAPASRPGGVSGGVPGQAPGRLLGLAALPPGSPAAPLAGPSAAAPAEAAPHYQSLTLRFGRQADGRYQVAMEAEAQPGEPSPGGPTPVASDLVIDAAALQARLWQGAVPAAGALRRASAGPLADAVAGAAPQTAAGGVAGGVAGLDAAVEATALPAAAASRAAGGQLHALLARTALGPALAARLRQVDPQRGLGLRLVVDTTDAPELARLPWELLYDAAQEDFIGADRFRPLVRRLSIDAPMPVLAVQPPLRLLVAVAQPADRPALQVGSELAHLDAALAGLVAEGRLQTRRLGATTLEALDEALLDWRPHLLHFIGHGDFDGDEGRILLEAAPGEAQGRSLSGRQLAVLLRNHLGSLRLVFLNSCLGAVGSAQAAFSGVAQSLLRRGVPATVAMQFALPDDHAVRLARHFYRYLAAGQPVDAALTSARAFLYAAGDEVGWASPVLYLNAPDGRLFDFGEGAPPAPAAPDPAPTPMPMPAPALPGSPSAAPPAEAHRADRAARTTAPGLPPPQDFTFSAGAPERSRSRRLPWIIGIVGGGALLLAALWLGLGSRPLQAPGGSIDLPSTAPSPVPVVPSPAPAMPDPVGAQPDDPKRTPDNLDPAAPGAPGGDPPPRIREERRDILAEQAARREAEAARRAAESRRWEARQRELQRELPPASPGSGLGGGASAGGGGGAGGGVAPGQGFSRTRSAGFGPDGQGWRTQVQPGDSWWSLSRRMSGQGARWPELQEAHRVQAARRASDARWMPAQDPDARLQAGAAVWVPLQQRDGQAGIALQVQRGDTLSALAQRLYGDDRQWPRLQHANRLPDPDRLRPGQVLWAPARR